MIDKQVSVAQLFETLPMRLRPAKAENVSLLLHFDLADDEEYSAEQFSVQIANSRCVVNKGLHGTPDCVINMPSMLYHAIELGNTNAQMAFLAGKIKVSNVAIMLEFGKLFNSFKPEYLTANEQQAITHTINRPTTQTKPNRNLGKGPLAGIRVLDLSRLLPGPLAGKMLADMGAEVIKIESPNSLDDTRNYPPFVGENGISVYYAALNAGKKSIALDLRQAADKVRFWEMVCEADVVLESFRPGVMKQIGIDYEALSKVNPHIIMVSVTGYGQQGPYSHQAGHDLNYLAISGVLGLNRQVDGKPVIPNLQMADVAGGAYLAVSGCLAALFHREKTGKGNWVDVAMTDGLLPLLSMAIAEYRQTKEVPQNGHTILSGSLPNYNVYQCADGKWVALGALEPKFWERFCRAVQKPTWVNCIVPNTKETMQVLSEVVELFATQPQAYWLNLAAENDMCLTPVNDLSEVCNDAHFVERSVFVSHEHTHYGHCPHIALPLKFAQTEMPEGWAAPLLGEDN